MEHTAHTLLYTLLWSLVGEPDLLLTRYSLLLTTYYLPLTLVGEEGEEAQGGGRR